MTSTRPTGTTSARLTSPHVPALVAAVAGYHGTVAARRLQAASGEVGDEITRRIEDETQAVTGLADALGLPRPELLGRTEGSSPLAAVSALAAAVAPLDQTLLADVGVARAVADRAYLARIASDDAGLGDSLERVETFYRDWAEWELEAAAEYAAGGLGRLEPTPVQRAAQRARQLATLPARAGREVAGQVTGTVVGLRDTVTEQAREAANEVAARVTAAVSAASEAAEKARDDVRQAAGHAVRIADAAWTAGLEAALSHAEQEARDERSPIAEPAENALHVVRAGLGVLSADELPVKDYDARTVPQARAAIDKLEDQQDLRALEAYERAHKGRKTVLAAIRDRSAALVADRG